MDYNDSIAMAQLGSAAIQTAGSILNSTFGYKHTMELAKWQNEMNRENWDIQNEYNLPKNQIQRLKDAGINPVLAYHNSADASNAGPMQPAQVGKPFSLDMQTIGNALNQVFGALIQRKQLESLDKDITSKEIKNRADSIELKKKALDYIFGYETKDSESEGFDVYGIAGGVPDTVSPDYNSVAYRNREGGLTKLLQDIAMLEKKGSLTDTQKSYYSELIKKVIADTGYIESKTTGQGYENDIKSVDADFASLGKALGLSEKALSIVKILFKFLSSK